MRPVKLKWTISLPVIFVVAEAVFFLGSAAGHGWGVGPMFLCAMPVSFLCMMIPPTTVSQIWMGIFGLLAVGQYALIGYWIDWSHQKRSKNP